MNTVSPASGIMYVIRTLNDPMTKAVKETADAWLPMWNGMGMMVCPVLSSAPRQHLNGRNSDRQPR